MREPISSNHELYIPFLKPNVFTRGWPRKISEYEIPNIKAAKQLKRPASAAPVGMACKKKRGAGRGKESLFWGKYRRNGIVCQAKRGSNLILGIETVKMRSKHGIRH
jgi:hypothetical protein